MLAKRIIPCLDIKDGRTVKGTNFVNLREAGDPLVLAKTYSTQGADELVFLDITATVEKRKTLYTLVREVAAQIDIPFTVGGGVQSVSDGAALLAAGADKVAINSAAVKNPGLIDAMASEFGVQCVVVAIDSRSLGGTGLVHVEGGRKATARQTMAWAKEAADRGAGEILLTAMDCDGTKKGFDTALTGQLTRTLDIPVIASGGAGTMAHFFDLFKENNADAALAASIFHFNEIRIPDLKRYLREKKIAVRYTEPET